MEYEGEVREQRHWLERLAALSVGRLVYTAGALPAVLPVRFRLAPDGSVMLYTCPQPELVRAVDGAVVAFEAGELSHADGSGWSVTVLGKAQIIAGPADGGQPGRSTQAEDQVVICLRPELVSGQLLEPAGRHRRGRRQVSRQPAGHEQTVRRSGAV